MSFPITNSLPELVKLQPGATHTVAEFYEKYAAPHLPAPAVMHHWHELLTRYVQRPDAILMLRRYHNWEKGKTDESLRRGFLSVDPTGFGYVFGDNVLPQFVAAWVMADELPTLEQWCTAMTERTMPLVGTRFVTQAERKYNIFALAPTILGNKGWKLAHLHSVNGTYAGIHYRTYIQALLPRGEYEDWAAADNIRRLQVAIAPDDRALLVAHFLRAVHPLNYFLSPGTSHQATRPDVGEAIPVQQYVRYQFGQLYGEQLVTDFEKLLLLDSQPAISDGQAAGQEQLALTVKWNAQKAPPPSAPSVPKGPKAPKDPKKPKADGMKLPGKSRLRPEDTSFDSGTADQSKARLLAGRKAQITAFDAVIARIEAFMRQARPDGLLDPHPELLAFYEAQYQKAKALCATAAQELRELLQKLSVADVPNDVGTDGTDDTMLDLLSAEQLELEERVISTLPTVYARLLEQHSERQIGVFAKALFTQLFADGQIESYLTDLQDPTYSRRQLGLSVPALARRREMTSGRYHHYTDPFIFQGREYYLSSGWNNGRREKLESWLTDNGF